MFKRVLTFNACLMAAALYLGFISLYCPINIFADYTIGVWFICVPAFVFILCGFIALFSNDWDKAEF